VFGTAVEGGTDMPWHEIDLSVERVAAGEGLRLMNELEKVFLAAGFPREAAVFTTFEMGRPGMIFWLNPGASEIAKTIIARWAGKERENPGPAALLIGHQDAYYTQNKKMPG
jgi:hypothetical protein